MPLPCNTDLSAVETWKGRMCCAVHLSNVSADGSACKQIVSKVDANKLAQGRLLIGQVEVLDKALGSSVKARHTHARKFSHVRSHFSPDFIDT